MTSIVLPRPVLGRTRGRDGLPADNTPIYMLHQHALVFILANCRVSLINFVEVIRCFDWLLIDLIGVYFMDRSRDSMQECLSCKPIGRHCCRSLAVNPQWTRSAACTWYMPRVRPTMNTISYLRSMSSEYTARRSLGTPSGTRTTRIQQRLQHSWRQERGVW